MNRYLHSTGYGWDLIFTNHGYIKTYYYNRKLEGIQIITNLSHS